MLSIKRDLLLEHKIDLLLVFQCVLCCVCVCATLLSYLTSGVEVLIYDAS